MYEESENFLTAVASFICTDMLLKAIKSSLKAGNLLSRKSTVLFILVFVALQHFPITQSQQRQTLNVNFFTPFNNKVNFAMILTHKQSIMNERDICRGLH